MHFVSRRKRAALLRKMPHLPQEMRMDPRFSGYGTLLDNIDQRKLVSMPRSMNPIPDPIGSGRIPSSDKIWSEFGLQNHWWIRRLNHRCSSFNYYSSNQYCWMEFYPTIGSDCRMRSDSNTSDPCVIPQPGSYEIHWILTKLQSVPYRTR
jgi:hypothetical protein